MDRSTKTRLGRIRRQKIKKIVLGAIVAGFMYMLRLVGAGIVLVICWLLLIILFSL